MSLSKKRIIRALPFAACFVFGVLALALHHIVNPYFSSVVYIQVPVCMVIPLLFPVARKWLKIDIPFFFEVIVAVQLIVSVDLGTALGVYYLIPHYDKYLHAYFGVWCAMLVYYFVHLWGGRNLARTGIFLIVLLSTLGVAGCWEIFEYFMSLIFGGDPQVWKAAVAAGKNPMDDTMWDMIVAAFGVGIFYLTLAADKLARGALYRGALTPQPPVPDEDEGEGPLSA